MTKKPLSAMSSAVKTSSSAVIAERRVSRYFEEDRLARAEVAEATSRGRHSFPYPPMRIVSLVPHATELLFALGLGDDVVAVTHECDYPARGPRAPARDPRRPPRGARRGARSTRPSGSAPRRARRSMSSTSGAWPSSSPTSSSRRRCAPSARSPTTTSWRSPRHARPRSRRSSRSTPRRSARRWATSARSPRRRVRATPRSTSSRASARGSTRVRRAVKGAEPVRVAAIEWLDPVFVAGHWTPQIIELAGGADVLGFAGEHSEQSTWEIVAAARPEVVVVMPCGYDAERSREEALAYADRAARGRREAGRRGRRGGVLLAPRPAAGRRPRGDGARAAPGPRDGGAGRGVRHRVCRAARPLSPSRCRRPRRSRRRRRTATARAHAM